MFILSDGDFFDDDGSQGIINGINNNCQYDTGLSQKKLLTSTLSGVDIVYAVGNYISFSLKITSGPCFCPWPEEVKKCILELHNLM